MMTRKLRRRRRADLAVAALLVALAGAFLLSRLAEAAGDQAQVIFSQKLPNVPGKTLTAVAVDYAPKGKSGPHHHAGVVFAYVVSGAIRSQVDAGPARVYQAGESFFEGPGAHHVVSENASDSKPAKLLAVFVADDGADLTTFDP
ncbi:MAG: cupin domain-containing protein [Candidatus Binatia bacterium]